MADKQIAKLSVQVGIDAGQADAGLQKLGRKVADFGAEISKTESSLAGFWKSLGMLGAGAAIGKLALDGAKFAATLESAAKSSDKMLEHLQAAAAARIEFDGMGDIGKMVALPGMAWEAAAAGLGRHLLKWSEMAGEMMGEGIADNAAGVLDEVRFGHTGPFMAVGRSLPGMWGDMFKSIDDITDRIVPWGERGWAGATWKESGLVNPAPRKEEKAMMDRMNEALELNRLKFAKFLESDMSKEIAQFWDGRRSLVEKLNEKIALVEETRQKVLDQIFNDDDAARIAGVLRPNLEKIEKYKAALEVDRDIAADQEKMDIANRLADEERAEFERTIDVIEQHMRFLNEEAEMYQSLKGEADRLAESSFTDFERFTAAIKDLDERFAEMAKELKGADLANAKAATEAAKAARQKQFEAGGMTDWESLIAQREDLKKQLDQATAANNQKAQEAIKRRMAKLALQGVGGIPDRMAIDYFGGGTTMWGSQEQHRGKWEGLLPKEHVLTADEKLQIANEKQDRQIEQNKRLIELMEKMANKVQNAPPGKLF